MDLSMLFVDGTKFGFVVLLLLTAVYLLVKWVKNLETKRDAREAATALEREKRDEKDESLRKQERADRITRETADRLRCQQDNASCVERINKSASSTPLDNEHVILMDCSGGNRTITLNAISLARNGKDILIRRVDNSGNTLTVTRSGSDTILDSANVSQTSVTIATGALLWLRGDFTNTRYVKMS